MITLKELNTDEGRRVALAVVNRHSNLLVQKTLAQLKDIFYYIVIGEEGPVGIVGFRPLNAWCVEQVNTVILPEFRSKGYGSEASEKMEKLLWGMGYGKIFCTVNSENKHMVCIKQKLGFTSEGMLKNHFGPGRSVYIFGKQNKDITI